MVTELKPDLTVLTYDDLFKRYTAAVAALGRVSVEDAARFRVEVIDPLNDELTRRSLQNHTG
jgi:hypothetical protein